MTDRQAFERTIIENPDDDAPRLVYADWLDEHGDADRAEFIRVQCELERIELGSPEATARHSMLSDRSRSLLATHEKKWDAELGSFPLNRLTYYLDRRGMVSAAVCTVKYFLAHGDRLLAVAPLKELRFRRVTPTSVRALLACRWSSGVRGISIDFRIDGGPAVDALLATWPFPAARTFDLSSHVIEGPSTAWHDRWADVAVAIARSPCLNRLRRLSMSGCGVGDAGGRALADSPHLNELTILDLKYNPMSESVRQHLRRRFGRGVFFDYADHAGWQVGALH